MYTPLSPAKLESKLHLGSISTDDAIPAIMYGVAHKAKMGLDIEQTIKVATTEMLSFWARDMNEIVRDMGQLSRG